MVTPRGGVAPIEGARLVNLHLGDEADNRFSGLEHDGGVCGYDVLWLTSAGLGIEEIDLMADAGADSALILEEALLDLLPVDHIRVEAGDSPAPVHQLHEALVPYLELALPAVGDEVGEALRGVWLEIELRARHHGPEDRGRFALGELRGLSHGREADTGEPLGPLLPLGWGAPAYSEGELRLGAHDKIRQVIVHRTHTFFSLF